MPVAHKFFPVDAPEGNRYPLCETDYFRRLGLICANCGTALRGSYITACSELPCLILLLRRVSASATSFDRSQILFVVTNTLANTHTDKKFHTDHFTCSICPVRQTPRLLPLVKCQTQHSFADPVRSTRLVLRARG